MTVKIKFVDTSGIIAERYYPKPARLALPEWFLNLEAYHGGKPTIVNADQNDTAKRCVPMMDVMSSGYILFAPTDIHVKPEPGNHNYSWPNGSGIELHKPHQLGEHKKAKQFNGVPKLCMDWAVWTPPGYSCLYTPPFNRHEALIEIFAGVIDTDKYHFPGSLPFLVKDPNFEGIIPAGTPVAQVIPFRRENYEMVIGSGKDANNARSQFNELRSVFRNAYRNFYWSPKSYK